MNRLIAAMCCIFAASALFAQPEPDHETKNDGEHYFERLKNDLKLSSEQQEKIKKIMQEHRPRIREAKRKKQEVESELKKLRQTETESIRMLLDGDQKEAFDEIQVQFRRRMRGAEEGGHGGHQHDHGKKERWWMQQPGDRLKPDARDLPPPEMWQDKDKKHR